MRVVSEAARVNSLCGGTRSAVFSSRDCWRTPRAFYQRLDAEFNFTLDAACTVKNCLAPAGFYRDHGHDALAPLTRWTWCAQGGAIWCNPPYSDIRPWLRKGRAASQDVAVVFLVPADTSTRWWVDLVAEDAAEVRFVVGRLRFLTPEGEEHTNTGSGGSTSPSALVIYKPFHAGPPVYSYTEARPRPARLPLSEVKRP